MLRELQVYPVQGRKERERGIQEEWLASIDRSVDGKKRGLGLLC